MFALLRKNELAMHNEEPYNPQIENGADKQIILARTILPETLPIIPIRGRPLFPRMVVPMIADDPYSRQTVEQLMQNEGKKYAGVVLLKQRANTDEEKNYLLMIFIKLALQLKC